MGSSGVNALVLNQHQGAWTIQNKHSSCTVNTCSYIHYKHSKAKRWLEVSWRLNHQRPNTVRRITGWAGTHRHHRHEPVRALKRQEFNIHIRHHDTSTSSYLHWLLVQKGWYRLGCTSSGTTLCPSSWSVAYVLSPSPMLTCKRDFHLIVISQVKKADVNNSNIEF